jgi:hypothetical protein
MKPNAHLYLPQSVVEEFLKSMASQLIKAQPTKSNRQIAKETGRSHPHVAKVRRDLAKDVMNDKRLPRGPFRAVWEQNGSWNFDRNGDVQHETDELDGTISGFRVVKADGPIGCAFQIDSLLGR